MFVGTYSVDDQRKKYPFGFVVRCVAGGLTLGFCLGVAIDILHITYAQSQLQQVVSTASAQGANYVSVDRNKAQSTAHDVITKNYIFNETFVLNEAPKVTLDHVKKQITVSAKITVRNNFMRHVGVKTSEVAASSTELYEAPEKNTP